MSDNNQNLPTCGNGHKQPGGGSKFCIYCGVVMVQAAQQNSPQPAPPAPMSPPVQNIPPTANHPAHQQQPPNFTPHHIGQPQVTPHHPVCKTCGGGGQGLADKTVICKECRWLRPLVPGYRVDNSAFAWAADARAMAALSAAKPLNAAAKAVSEKVGRRWIEVSFNGVQLGEKQMPHIFGQAVRAARILGMTHMPDIYLSGERAWDCLTFGSETNSFIVVGSALAGNFQGIDMLFLLAREMGHCKAGHALWKTVIRFFLGEQGPSKGFMAGGIFNAILSPTNLISGAMEMPLLAWARQAEITADRAGLLTVGSEDVARRVLLSWSLKSSFIYRQINIESWLEQQGNDDGDMLRLSELTTSSTPYLGPRLKLLSQFAQSPELQLALKQIKETIQSAGPPPSAKPAPTSAPIPDVLRIKCASCQTPMRIAMSALAGKTELPVKCPDPKCGEITRLKKNLKPAEPKANKMEENLNYAE